MKGRSLSALLSVLIVIICTVPAEALTGNICDDHCWPKRCPKPGTCGTACLPRLYWRLRAFDQTCQPRCGGNCLYCSHYYWCDVCWKGYYPVVVGNQRLCRQSPPVVPIKCDVNCLSATDCTVAGQCNTLCKAGYENVNKRCVLITTTTAPTTVAEFTTIPQTIPPEMTTQPPVITTVAPTVPPEFTTVPDTTPIPLTPPFPCDPNCVSTDTCYVGVNKCDHSCNANYILYTGNYCSECDVQCTPTSPGSCSTPGLCSGTCVAPYILDAGTQLCQPCPTTCSACSSLTSCTTCGPTTVQNPPTCSACDPQCNTACVTASKCDGTGAACKAGYGLTRALSPTRCGACDANCDPANPCNTAGSGLCDGPCKPGYLLLSGMCYACQTPNPQFCASCASPGTCDTCVSGYTLAGGVCS